MLGVLALVEYGGPGGAFAAGVVVTGTLWYLISDDRRRKKGKSLE